MKQRITDKGEVSQYLYSRDSLEVVSTLAVSQLNLLHSERPKLYAILAFLSAIGLRKKKVC